MNVAHVMVVSPVGLIIVTVFTRQIVVHMRSGKVRPRASKVYKTREDDLVVLL